MPNSSTKATRSKAEQSPPLWGLLVAGNLQLCMRHLPHEAAEEAKKEAHEPNLVSDLGGDGLLAVGTHRLHRGTLEDLSLQHCHCGGSARWDEHSCCVAAGRGVVAWGRVVAHGGMRAWRWVITCWE